MSPEELVDIGREISRLEVRTLWVLSYYWWVQSERELLYCLCRLTELWGIVEDEQRKWKAKKRFFRRKPSKILTEDEE